MLDVALLWFTPECRYRRIPHIVVRVLAFVIFALTLVVLRGGTVLILGFIFVSVLFMAGLIRLITHVRATA
jgi:hypothetical protein